MKVFKYLDDRKSIADTYRIYKAILNLEWYAKTKYKNWEDAMDEAFFHVLDNYDSSKGDLDNYATRVVGTIYLNKNRREVTSSEKTQITLDLQEAEFYDMPEELYLEDNKSVDLGSCIIDTIPFFINDYKFFVSSNSKDRKLDYKNLLNRYTYETVNEAKKFLIEKYGDKVGRIVEYGKNTTLKNFSEDRYLKSRDTGLEYKGSLNEIILVRRGKGSHSKKLFKISIESLIESLIGLFYCDEGYGKVVIEGVGVYLSIAGNFVIGENNLRKALETELIGSILSRTSLKVVNYIKGEEILFSSTQDHQYNVVLPMFGKDVGIGFERVVCKEVS